VPFTVRLMLIAMNCLLWGIETGAGPRSLPSACLL
jgi:hypothetical protein